MTKEQVFDVWAPHSAWWTHWVKPVLFSFMQESCFRGAPSNAGVSTGTWMVPCQQDVAIVVDLPGDEGVRVGLALAKSGYRPIPLYNACPFAEADPTLGQFAGISGRAPAVVDSNSIMRALYLGTSELASLKLKADAPPAFLLDANRRGHTYFPGEGFFDNRSVVSPLDVPSGTFLRQNQVNHVVVVQAEARTGPDLLEILLAWQMDGIVISLQVPWRQWAPEQRRVSAGSPVLRLWRKLQLFFGYRRNESGDFGRLIHGGSG